MIKIPVETNKKEEFIEITSQIENEIKKSNKTEGLATIYCPHTTAGLTINENADPDVRTDIIAGLNSIGFEKLDFRHFEGNSPAHVKASLMGSSLSIIIENGKPVLGKWQGIFFCEFDGPRTRKVFLNIF